MLDFPVIWQPVLGACLLSALVGFSLGLAGYSSARRTAYRDFVAASQRSRIHTAQLDAMGADFIASQPSP